PVRVGMSDAARHIRNDARRLRGTERSLDQDPRQIGSLDELHCEEGWRSVARGNQLHDVRVLERREHAALAFKTPDAIGAARSRDELERDREPIRAPAGLENEPHAATAELGLDDEAPDLTSGP